MDNQRVEQATAAVRSALRWEREPVLAIVLGTGLGVLPPGFRQEASVDMASLPGFPRASAPTHSGLLVAGSWLGVPVLVQQGRFHLYEGHPTDDVVLPIYVMRRLGARRLVVTNAAGALNPAFRAGEAMLINDQINVTGVDPLRGMNDPELGLRFPDMTDCYAPELRLALNAAALRLDVGLREGIYVGVHGPTMETSAERRYLRTLGADAVGMSTVLEVIAARHCGFTVAGISALTNAATGGPEQKPHTIEEIMANAATAGAVIWQLLEASLTALSAP